MRVVYLVSIHMAHLRIVIRIGLLLGSILAVLFLVFVFSSSPNGRICEYESEKHRIFEERTWMQL